MLSAIAAGRFLDRSLTVVALVGVSTPAFFLGALLLYYLGYRLGAFYRSGAMSP